MDVINNGTIDAKIQNINMTSLDTDVIKYLSYTATYLDETEIAENDVLKATDSTTYKVRVEFKKNINATDLSEEDMNLVLTFGVNYVQSKMQARDAIYSESWDFNYIDDEDEFIVPYNGTYMLEVWGAQGGIYESMGTGYGGYSVGYVDLLVGETLYINAGGQGNVYAGGYNGGGNGGTGSGQFAYGGGGATHIALESGLLKSFENKQDKLLIVAGGGGGNGGGYDNTTYLNSPGGYGGGYVGTNGYDGYNKSYSHYYNGVGATQTAGGNSCDKGSFGQGSNFCGYYGGAGGGGGYYGGGGSSRGHAGGGGGSGYIGNPNLYNKVMYCYECSQPSISDSNYDNIKTISVAKSSNSPISKSAKQKDGHARITYIDNSDIIINSFAKTNNSVDLHNIEFDNKSGVISFQTSLDNVESYAELTFQVENLHQDIDYYLSKISKGTYDDSKIEYTVTYLDGAALKEKNFLKSGDIEYINIKIQLLDDTYSFENNLFTLKLTYQEAKENENYSRVSWKFNYTASEKHIDIPYTGLYKLEVWGAEGGNRHGSGTYKGGYGGYSKGIIQLTQGETLYINVGGQGSITVVNNTFPGGYNGGGNGGLGQNNNVSTAGGGGGGATHIATTSGLLATLESKKDNILIVAAGGGGSGHTPEFIPGSGGGFQGVNSTPRVSGNAISYGATQTTGYAFGQGQAGRMPTSWASFGAEGNGGSGGGYYGGFASQTSGSGSNSAGSGGSGYIGNDSLDEKVMYCYKCAESQEITTKTISTTDVSETPISQYAKLGDGYALITYLGE